MQQLTQRLAKLAGLNKQPMDLSGLGMAGNSSGSRAGSRMNSIRGSKRKVDLNVLDKLVTNLLEQQANEPDKARELGSSSIYASIPATNRKASMKLNRWRPTSRSAHSFNITEGSTNFSAEHGSSAPGSGVGGGGGDVQHMPTIMESTAGMTTTTAAATRKNNNETSTSSLPRSQRTSWSSSLERTPGAVRNVLRNISAATVNTGSAGGGNEENLNLTQNYIA